jgi:hypothetical protein
LSHWPAFVHASEPFFATPASELQSADAASNASAALFQAATFQAATAASWRAWVAYCHVATAASHAWAALVQSPELRLWFALL